MTNNFKAVNRITQELEAEVNAVPIRSNSAKLVLNQALRHLARLQENVRLAESFEREAGT